MSSVPVMSISVPNRYRVIDIHDYFVERTHQTIAATRRSKARQEEREGEEPEDVLPYCSTVLLFHCSTQPKFRDKTTWNIREYFFAAAEGLSNSIHLLKIMPTFPEKLLGVILESFLQ